MCVKMNEDKGVYNDINDKFQMINFGMLRLYYNKEKKDNIIMQNNNLQFLFIINYINN